MSAKFLETFGSKLAERWVASLLTPAFVFWTGGAWVGLQRIGWQTISTWFDSQAEPLQIALLIAVIAVIAASAFVVQRFELSVLRLLEGYWSPWLRPLRRWLIRREEKRSQKIGDRWQYLMHLDHQAKDLLAPDPSHFTHQQRSEAIALIGRQRNRSHLSRRLNALPTQKLLERIAARRAELRHELAYRDWQQHEFPLPDQLMPTRLGNILRAAEQRPREKYGLNAVICWSRLWLLLPDAVKQELQTARADLNTAARVWLWSLLFMVWAIVGAWWALPLGLLSAIFAYYSWALAAASTYGELIDATFDLYRHLLYESLRWNLPPDPNVERQVGEQLTEYLWRGK